MVRGIGSDLNNLQIMRAEQAFKSAIKYSVNMNPAYGNNVVEDVDVNIKITSDKEVKNESNTPFTSHILEKNKELVNDVKQFASKFGNNLDDEDIDYALRYGKSVLVDRVV